MQHLLLPAALIFGALFLAPRGGEAQVAVGVHGTALDWSGGTFGGGGRLAITVARPEGFLVALEGMAEYLVPNCRVDCHIAAYHLNVLGKRQITALAEAYGGAGLVYEDLTIEEGTAAVSLSDWGINLLGGNQFGRPGGIRPFIEVRWTLMFNVRSQLGASLGVRLPFG